MNWKPIKSPVPKSKAYKDDLATQLIVIVDDDKSHLSISHPTRYPLWDEIHGARDDFLLADKTYAMFFPPASEYVNISKNCFHLYEVKI